MKGQVIRLRYVCPLAVAIGLGAAPVAWAADIPSRPPVLKAAPIAAANWTGFYVNGGLGYGLWAADTSVALVPGSGNVALPFMQRQGGKGYLGVIGGGFDYQFSPRLVGGVFADFDFASLKGTVQDQSPFFGGDIKETSAWAVGARGGYLINPERLTYVNAGYTNAHFSSAQMVTRSRWRRVLFPRRSFRAAAISSAAAWKRRCSPTGTGAPNTGWPITAIRS